MSKISIITTITNPEENQYPWQEALESYCALADEVIVVNGGRKSIYDFKYDYDVHVHPKIKEIMLPWPDKWHWSELPVHLNAGLEKATGDRVIKCDIDYIFHEKDIESIKYALENDGSKYAVACFVKKIIVDKTHYFKKCRISVAINKGLVGDTIKFGIDPDEKTDWCLPILVKGKQVFDKNEVPTGKVIPANMVYDTGLNIYNYDCFFRTAEVQRREFWRFAQAYRDIFNISWGDSEQESFEFWVKMMKNRKGKQLYLMSIEDHPRFIKKRVRNMKPEEFGFDNWKGLKND